MSEANAAGSTMSRAVFVAIGWGGELGGPLDTHPPAVMSTEGGSVTTLGLAATGLVCTTKLAVRVPGGTATTLCVTVAMAVLPLTSFTETPGPAFSLRVTMTVTVAPPMTLD